MVSESKSLTGCKKVKRTAFIRGGYKVNKLKRLSMLTVMIASVFIFLAMHLRLSIIRFQQAAVLLSTCAAAQVQVGEL